MFDTPSPRPHLTLVTGSPGAGKSALLGITVCATHPELSELTEPLWHDHRDDLPAVHDAFAAVHCRQRDLGGIVAALARQLDVPVVTSDPGVLVAALKDAGAVPPVVLDALDEAMDPSDVMTRLILPLSVVARVVVGVRPWPQFDPLRHNASTVIELDDVPVADLAAYVDDLLRPVYRTAALRDSRQTIAANVAAALTRPSTDDTRWGAFLVAGLYAHQLRNRPAITDLTEAAAVGRAVPRTLPAVFELNLTTGDNQSWRRVLTVLARSFGAGMPRSLVDAVVGPDVAAEVLDAARFYLRHDTDEDGTVLYRLFHQGLADHLRRRAPASEEALFTALISSLGSPPRWRDAEPYLLRHAFDHVMTTRQYASLLSDPGFLVFGVPRAIRLGYGLKSYAPNATGFVYLTSFERHENLSPVRRRSVLVVDAHRLGYRAMADRLAGVADLPAPRWAPRWATANGETLRQWRNRLNTAQPSSLVIGGDMVAVGDRTGLSVTDVGTGEVTTSSAGSLGQSFRCLAVGRGDGRVVALVVRSNRPPAVWDVAAQAPMFTCAKSGRIDLAVFCEDAGTPLLVAVEANFGVVAWRLPDGRPFRRHKFPRRLDAVAVGSVGGRVVVAVARDHRLEVRLFFGRAKNYVSVVTGDRIVSLAVGELDGHGVVLCGHQDGAVDLRSAEDLGRIRRFSPDDGGSPSGPLAFGERDGVPVAFLANQSGVVSTRELATGARLPGSWSDLGPLTALLPGTVADRPVVVTSNGREAGVFDVDTGARISSFAPAEPRPVDFGQDGPVVERTHNGAVCGVAVFDDVVASASTDGTARLWDLGTGAPRHLLAGHRGWVRTVALGRINGRRVALTGSTNSEARLWDVDSGAPVHLLTGHKGWIRAAAFLPGDERGVTAGDDGTVRVWDLGKGKCVRVFRTAARNTLMSVACGQFVVAGGADGLVHVWRSAQEQTFAGHDGTVRAVALSGTDVVLSGGEDRVVRMWRVSDGVCVHTFTGFTATVNAISTGWWQDRPVVLAGSEDGTVLGWDIEDGVLLAEATFPGTIGGVDVGTEGRVAIGFGNDVGVIQLRS